MEGRRVSLGCHGGCGLVAVAVAVAVRESGPLFQYGTAVRVRHGGLE